MHTSRMARLLVAAAFVVAAFFGVAAPALAADQGGPVEMHRLYNPNSGEHFYTANTTEYKNLVSLGWRDEGIGWYAPAKSNVPVYRLYNPNAGDHHYTTSAYERDFLVKVGWKYEQIGWYSSETKAIEIYRQYNPNAYSRPGGSGAHNYTASKGENDHLVSVGWRAEGIGWYGMKAEKKLNVRMILLGQGEAGTVSLSEGEKLTLPKETVVVRPYRDNAVYKALLNGNWTFSMVEPELPDDGSFIFYLDSEIHKIVVFDEAKLTRKEGEILTRADVDAVAGGKPWQAFVDGLGPVDISDEGYTVTSNIYVADPVPVV